MMELLILLGVIVVGGFILMVGLSIAMSALSNPDHLEYMDEE
jgi:hypothetical protein